MEYLINIAESRASFEHESTQNARIGEENARIEAKNARIEDENVRIGDKNVRIGDENVRIGDKNVRIKTTGSWLKAKIAWIEYVKERRVNGEITGITSAAIIDVLEDIRENQVIGTKDVQKEKHSES